MICDAGSRMINFKVRKDYTIGTLHYNWPMSAHAACITGLQHGQCTDRLQYTHAQSFFIFKGELNPETNVGLNEYLHEIKFCTGQESVDVVQRKKITTYLLTLKIVSPGRTEVVIVRIILLSMLRQHLRKLF